MDADYTEKITIMKQSPTRNPRAIGGVWAIGYDEEGKYIGFSVTGDVVRLTRAFGIESTFKLDACRQTGLDTVYEAANEGVGVRFQLSSVALQLSAKLLPTLKRATAITTETGELIGYIGTDNKPRLFARMGYETVKKVHIPEDRRAMVIPSGELEDIETDADGVILEVPQ